ncbi:MAG: DHH family phosphoesterase, partial [DPANN group archaeon]|nr:DHH family phosphoesterase [DPANN group archaeon]
MGIAQAKKKAEAIHVRYKQLILSGIKYAENAEKITGKGFVIINAKEEIKDTMAGTITSILSHSRLYEEGTIITILAHYEDKIKISCRVVGKNGRNVREILNNIITVIGGETGGHYNAAGATISQDKEEEFLKILKKNLEIEVIKIQ